MDTTVTAGASISSPSPIATTSPSPMLDYAGTAVPLTDSKVSDEMYPSLKDNQLILKTINREVARKLKPLVNDHPMTFKMDCTIQHAVLCLNRVDVVALMEELMPLVRQKLVSPQLADFLQHYIVTHLSKK